MRRVTLSSLWAHKQRLVSTIVAIVLGVGFMSGTFILSTTLDQVADDLFRDAASEIDALVQGEVFAGGAVGSTQREALPEEMVDRVRQVDGVAAAAPRVSTRGTGSTNRLLPWSPHRSSRPPVHRPLHGLLPSPEAPPSRLRACSSPAH